LPRPKSPFTPAREKPLKRSTVARRVAGSMPSDPASPSMLSALTAMPASAIALLTFGSSAKLRRKRTYWLSTISQYGPSLSCSSM